jgi:hypothetical protein
LAAVRGNSGGGKIGSPQSLGVAASDPDQVDCLPDLLGAARRPSRGTTAQAVDDPACALSLEVQMAGISKISQLQDTQALRAMWESGVSAKQIGEAVGMAASSVNTKAKMFGYPSRARGGVLRGPMPSHPPVDAVAHDVPQEFKVEAQTHPRWPVEYDAAILKTDGKYSRISNLSKSLGRSVNAILGRWHQLRAM